MFEIQDKKAMHREDPVPNLSFVQRWVVLERKESLGLRVVLPRTKGLARACEGWRPAPCLLM